jgi:hypothetical protein
MSLNINEAMYKDVFEPLFGLCDDKVILNKKQRQKKFHDKNKY